METIYSPASICHTIQLLYNDSTSTDNTSFTEIEIRLRNKEKNETLATIFKLSDGSVTLVGTDSCFIILDTELVATLHNGTFEHIVTTTETNVLYTDSKRIRKGIADAFIVKI